MGSREARVEMRKRVKDLTDAILLMGSEAVIDVGEDSYYGGWVDALTWIHDKLLKEKKEE